MLKGDISILIYSYMLGPANISPIWNISQALIEAVGNVYNCARIIPVMV